MSRTDPSREDARSDARNDARHLDISAFCRHAGELAGEWSQSTLSRLVDDLQPRPGDLPPPAVRWSARGELRPVTGGEAELWLSLQAQTEVALQCQRCLQSMSMTLQVDRRLRFVRGEDEAARLDEESDDDVLALAPRTDLQALLEDELILALPLVPRHDTCPAPLPLSTGPAVSSGASGASGAPDEAPAPHPFAALAAWREAGKKPKS